MNVGKTLFAQIMDFVPWTSFSRIVDRHAGNAGVHRMTCAEQFRVTKAAIKLHTLLDLRGAIPAFIHISDGKMHDVKVLDILPIEAGAF